LEEDADAKTAKNRAKRLKKKERSKTKGNGSGGQKEDQDDTGAPTDKPSNDAPLKKRRLVNGSELVFRKPGEEEDGDGDEEDGGPLPMIVRPSDEGVAADAQLPVAESNMVIHDDD